MLSATCATCGHGNTAGAKYCNECGAPLHLKPCPKCEAVNHRSAIICYKCGAAYPTEPAGIESRPPSGASGAAADQPVFEQGKPPQAIDEVERRPERATIPTLTNPIAFFEGSLVEAARRTFPSPRRNPTPRAPLVGRNFPLRFGLLAVVAIGTALLGYLAYRLQMQDDAATGGAPVASANVERNLPIRAGPAAPGGDASAGRSLVTPVGVIESAILPTNPSGADRRADKQTDAPDSAAPVPTPSRNADDASPKTASALSAPRPSVDMPQDTAKSQIPNRPPLRHATKIPPPKRTPEATRFAVAPPVGGGRDKATVDRGPPRVCTAQVAALGLCPPQPDGNGG